MDNNNLIRLAQAGDEGALNQIIIQNEGLIRHALNLMGIISHPLAEDMIQVARLAITRAALTHDEDIGKFSTYAMRTIKNAILSDPQFTNKFDGISVPIDEIPYPERDEWLSTIYDPEPSSEDAAAHIQTLNILDDVLSTLSAGERSVIERIYFHEETQAEIAEDEGLTQQAIACREKAALQKIRKALEMRGMQDDIFRRK